jgi:hypothetical protein
MSNTLKYEAIVSGNLHDVLSFKRKYNLKGTMGVSESSGDYAFKFEVPKRVPEDLGLLAGLCPPDSTTIGPYKVPKFLLDMWEKEVIEEVKRHVAWARAFEAKLRSQSPLQEVDIKLSKIPLLDEWDGATLYGCTPKEWVNMLIGYWEDTYKWSRKSSGDLLQALIKQHQSKIALEILTWFNTVHLSRSSLDGYSRHPTTLMTAYVVVSALFAKYLKEVASHSTRRTIHAMNRKYYPESSFTQLLETEFNLGDSNK